MTDKIQEDKRMLNQDFEMSDIREPKNYLGLEIERDKKAKVLKQFGYENSHPQRTPMVTKKVSNRERIGREIEW